MEILWKVDNLEVKPEIDSFQNVVWTVHWRVFAKEGDVTSSVYGSRNLTFDPTTATNFINYDNLTQSQVIDWVKTSMGSDEVENIESAAVSELNRVLNPPIVTKPLPWNVQG